MRNTITAQIDEFAEFTSSIHHMPQTLFQSAFDRRLALICSEAERQDKSAAKTYFFHRVEALTQGVMQNRVRNKPLGYAGDYLTIDWMYLKQTSDSAGAVWDRFYHAQDAAIAVRERKDTFRRTVQTLARRKAISVLDLASGPCRDVLDAILTDENRLHRTRFHCVDMDVRANDHARELFLEESLENRVEWETTNVFRLKPASQYDFVWSAGLFDYLNDRMARALLAKMWSWTAEDGLMMIGNFHPRNRTRNYMDWCMRWDLIHRTEEDLRMLAVSAGINESCISIHVDSHHTCVFLMAHRVI